MTKTSVKLLVLSDLHLEFKSLVIPPKEGYDVVVLAGDISTGISGVEWAKKTFDVPVVYVAGNHEYYGENLEELVEKLKACAKDSNVHVLENDMVTLFGVSFIGATLWTDFRLYGDHLDFTASITAKRSMNDYKRIRKGSRLLQPRDTSAKFEETIVFFSEAFKLVPLDAPVVVVTHHLPSKSSVDSKYGDDILNAAFASNLDRFVIGYNPKLWIHGHTHTGCDYNLGGTRVVCNPGGYPYPNSSARENFEFNPGLIVEV